MVEAAWCQNNGEHKMSKSVFADDLLIKGNVTSEGDIQLNGVVEGELSARTLRTGDGATIRGSATVEKAVLGGNVEGSVHGGSVRLESSANVQDEVVSNALSVDEEAYFDGTSKRVKDQAKGRHRGIK